MVGAKSSCWGLYVVGNELNGFQPSFFQSWFGSHSWCNWYTYYCTCKYCNLDNKPALFFEWNCCLLSKVCPSIYVLVHAVMLPRSTKEAALCKTGTIKWRETPLILLSLHKQTHDKQHCRITAWVHKWGWTVCKVGVFFERNKNTPTPARWGAT